MGGSILGTKAIYDFLRNKIKKKIIFHDNLESNLRVEKKNINLIISKSGNTLETITNANILIKNQKIFTTKVIIIICDLWLIKLKQMLLIIIIL